jgi:membrane-associated phospholipid phosphatase
MSISSERLVPSRSSPSTALVGAAAAMLVARTASADATLSEKRSTDYYVAHASIAGATLIGAPIVDALLSAPDDPARVDAWFCFEGSVNGNMSATAATWSDRLVFATVAGPAFAEIGSGTDRTLTNHSIVYAETLGVQLALNVTVKHLVRRARPYTHNPNPLVAEFRQQEGGDANLSFYSGHSSAAFAAAVAGSYLFGAKTADPWSRRIIWFSELGLATSTAHLRVRAGMHYYSDVLVGMLVGTGLGIAMPYLHGDRYKPDAGDYAAASAGFVVGALVPLLVATDDVRVPWSDASISFRVTPWMPPDGAGAMVSGAF